MWLAHPRQMRQTQGLTGLVHPSTDVFPEGEAQTNYARACYTSFRINLKVLYWNHIMTVSLAWWPAQLHHDEQDACHSGDLSFSARHKNWPKWCLHCDQSSTLSALKSRNTNTIMYIFEIIWICDSVTLEQFMNIFLTLKKNLLRLFSLFHSEFMVQC